MRIPAEATAQPEREPGPRATHTGEGLCASRVLRWVPGLVPLRCTRPGHERMHARNSEEKMRIAKFVLPALALAYSLAIPAHAQTPEKKSITLGVGGKTALYYLPLTIAERLGYFKEQ